MTFVEWSERLCQLGSITLLLAVTAPARAQPPSDASRPVPHPPIIVDPGAPGGPASPPVVRVEPKPDPLDDDRAGDEAAEARPSSAELEANVDLTDGTRVALRAATDDETREVRMTLRVPPGRPDFGEVFLTSLGGFAVAAGIGAVLGLGFGLGVVHGNPDAAEDSPAAALFIGAALAGVHGTGIALGALRGGPLHAAVLPSVLSPFGAYAAGGATALGWLLGSPPQQSWLVSLAGFGATLLVGPLLSAALYAAAPGDSTLTVGPGSVAGTF